jgi:hypothetical protein
MSNLQALPAPQLAWVVKISILQYLRGLETAYRFLGDNGSVFHDFVAQTLPIHKAEDYRWRGPSNSPDYRGMIAMAMDDLGLRDHQQRDQIMELLTGVTREEEEAEAFRLHRISQGDWWLRKLTDK